MVLTILVGLGSFALGYFVASWWLLGGFKPTSAPANTYEVRLAQTTPLGPVNKVLYSGDGLQEAKTVFKNAVGPKSSLVELYTRGYHTASRRVDG